GARRPGEEAAFPHLSLRTDSACKNFHLLVTFRQLLRRPRTSQSPPLCLSIPHPFVLAGRRSCVRKGVGPRESFDPARVAPEFPLCAFDSPFFLPERTTARPGDKTQEIAKFHDAAIHGQEPHLRRLREYVP